MAIVSRASKTGGLVTARASVTCMGFQRYAYLHTADSNFCERGWSARLYKCGFATMSCVHLHVHMADRRTLYMQLLWEWLVCETVGLLTVTITSSVFLECFRTLFPVHKAFGDKCLFAFRT